MRAWKWVGLAAFAGVAATGVMIARAERQRRSYTPDEIRHRLRQRHAERPAEPQPPPAGTRPPTPE
jgi:hypothetical protein